MVHLQPLVEILRYYSSGSYDVRSPFDLVITLTWDTDTQVTFSGMMGKFSFKARKAIYKALTERGATSYRIYRKGKWTTKHI